MLATPPLTTTDLQHQLDTQDEVRLAATADEYFTLLDEQNDAVYLEFHQNQLLARPNVNTENHELITATFIGLLYKHLSDNPEYRIFGSNRPVYVMDCEQGFAPDVLIVKGPTELYPRRRAMAATLNPWLLVEVLSASNRSDEFQDKIHCYKQIPTLQHFFLIASDSMMVSAYTRTDRPNQWLNIDYAHPDEAVPIDTITLSMNELYRNVVFPKR